MKGKRSDKEGKRYWLAGWSLLIAIASCAQSGTANDHASSSPKYEFRGAWIASVDHIDWPSKTAAGNVALQKQEFIDLLDMHQRNGLNAVVVQIRPTADAFYPSPYEPWSAWLTGKQGTPPEPYYDPLSFMIAETHKRGMEFHAWINPYRALFNSRKDVAAITHITRLHPEWFLVYDNTTLFNPGEPEVWNYVTNVIRYIVHNYPVDAIHFDDYFYPYRVSGQYFADDATYRKYNRGLDKETWRRSNVDSIIRRISRVIKVENPYCKFGISPFGVWRNKYKDPEGSNTRGGQTDYDDLYADILLWLKEGWIDYVAPQIYWERSHKLCSYDTLVNWWHDHSYGKQVFVGIGLYKAGYNAAWRNPRELPEQVVLSRELSQGCIYFSSQNFIKNPNGWSDSLADHYYKYPALVPPMPWIDDTVPLPPRVTQASGPGNILVSLDATGARPVRLFIVYHLPSGPTGPALDPSNIYRVIPADQQKGSFYLSAPGATNGKWVVTAVSMQNVESLPVSL